ncbi:hypothetical protein C4588_01635 [Candidatus Parcubacteria bacterium]|nr:MAG: hypothetical protein C4588_01635 [Candidatus Parcubacteria bacterium]
MDRLTPNNLELNNKNKYETTRRECEVALRAIRILEKIHKAIRDAGGGAEIESVADTTIAEFAIMAARNHIEVNTAYVKPEKLD